MKALVWPVATYGYESWTLRKNEETRLDASDMKWLRKILWVSWTAKKTNEWVLNKAGIKRELLDTIKARKLPYYGHTVRKQWSCLEKKIMQVTMPGARRRGRPRTAWMDNIKSWTGLYMEESIKLTEDRDKYDTIRDAILMCARKPTWVSLIYCTETTTENVKQKKLKSKNSLCYRSNCKSLGNHVVSPEKEKKAAVGRTTTTV